MSRVDRGRMPFSKIVRKELEAEVVHEDEHVMAFWYRNPRRLPTSVVGSRRIQSLQTW
jgi:diadenosine tetraphosphate (Ap4A) HIT family hydrolase